MPIPVPRAMYAARQTGHLGNKIRMAAGSSQAKAFPTRAANESLGDGTARLARQEQTVGFMSLKGKLLDSGSIRAAIHSLDEREEPKRTGPYIFYFSQEKLSRLDKSIFSCA